MKKVLVLLLIFCGFPSLASDGFIRVRDISLFRSQVVLAVYGNHNVKVGSKLLAKSAAHHKCLLIVTKINGDTAYTDATRCTGFATLKRGQVAQISDDSEVNEEIKETQEIREAKPEEIKR